MKRHLAALIAAAACGSTGAAEAAPAHLIILKMSGDRGWSVDCTFERDGREPLQRKARGRGAVETFAVRSATGGSCAYEAANGVLQIRFTNERDEGACPFTRVDGECIGRFSDGEKGGFEF